MGGEVGRTYSLPLLPAGERLFSNLPARAIVLPALAPALGDGIITVVDGERMAVLVVSNGAIADAVSNVNGVQETGDAAMALMRDWESASISCCRLSAEAMSLLGPLLHGELVYSDLRLEWTAWSQLLDDLRTRGQTFVVELQTPIERGVTVIRRGEQVATFSESQPALGGPDILDVLAASGEGSIRVLAAVAPRDGDSRTPASDRPVTVATHMPRPISSLDEATSTVLQAGYDDANTTFASLFGVPETEPSTPILELDQSGPVAARDVVSLVPELKLLARRRLQRSSAPVEDAVDRAASENQSVDRLVASVRVMRVRGFVPETFEHLADEMQALIRNT
jgi:hypothetical protein